MPYVWRRFQVRNQRDGLNDVINGDLRANLALAVILHGNTLNGNAWMTDGRSTALGSNTHLSEVLGLPVPAYSGFENNTINGPVVVSDYGAFWLGFIRNHLHGSILFSENTAVDPIDPAFEVQTNWMQVRVASLKNKPAPDIDAGAGGVPNTVSGKKSGQCVGL